MQKEKGFLMWILLAIVALGLLKYFLNWDVFDAASSVQGKSTIGYIKHVVDVVWSVIATPVTFVWSKIIWPVIAIAWDSLQELIQKGKGVPISVGIPSA